MKEIEVICPDCWAESTIKADEVDNEIFCDDCGFGYYIEDSVGDE